MHVKEHLKKYWPLYAGGTIAVAGITYAIVRSSFSQPITGGISVRAKDGISVLGKKVVMNDVSYIHQNRQGPPSWVVRCIETGDIFSSQNKAAEALAVPSQEISKQINGLMDTARGYTFERICLSA